MNGCAWHGHSGDTSDYVQQPDWIGVKLRGRTEETVQSWTQLLSLVTVTGITMPSMLDDFSHLWQDESPSFEQNERRCMRRQVEQFRESMREPQLTRVIQRNHTRVGTRFTP